jgi:hypothetical protein
MTIEGITSQPCSQPLEPCSAVPEGQKGSRTVIQPGRFCGKGGGFNASNKLRNKPAIDHKVRLVNHAIRLRGLRVTTYIPNQTAAIKKTKLANIVMESSIEFLSARKKVYYSPLIPEELPAFYWRIAVRTLLYFRSKDEPEPSPDLFDDQFV